MTLPLGLMVWLFIAQAQKEIAFSAHEVRGLDASQPLWKAHWTLSAPGAETLALPGPGREMAATVEEHEAAFKAGASTRDFAQALAAPRADVDRLSLGKTAIQRVADGSNLTLDPDVDSYYLMDVVMFRLPELAAAQAELRATARIYFDPAAKPTSREFVSFIRAVGRLEAAADPVHGSLKSSVGGNADGSVARAIAAWRHARQRRPRHAEGRPRRIREHPGEPLAARAQGRLRQGRRRAARATGQLWTVTAGELKRLLDLRIAGLEANQYRQLAYAGGLLVVIALLAIFMARRIRSELADQIDALQRFRKATTASRSATPRSPTKSARSPAPCAASRTSARSRRSPWLRSTAPRPCS